MEATLGVRSYLLHLASSLSLSFLTPLLAILEALPYQITCRHLLISGRQPKTLPENGFALVVVVCVCETSYNSTNRCFTHACRRQGSSTPSYVFFQRGQLLIQSHSVCPERKCPLLSVRRARWELPGPCGLCYQLLRGIDDFQDFCGDVAERNSRILLFGPTTEGDRRQEQHINNDMEILHYHGVHHEIASTVTDTNFNAPKEREAKQSTQQLGLRGGLI